MADSIQLFDYVNSINTKSQLKDPDFINYVPFVVNRALAQHKSTILIAQELNLLSSLTPEQHFNYAFNSVTKGKRFGKWAKKEEYTEDEVNISRFFNVNLDTAREYRLVISESELEHINRQYPNDNPDPKKPDKQP